MCETGMSLAVNGGAFLFTGSNRGGELRLVTARSGRIDLTGEQSELGVGA